MICLLIDQLHVYNSNTINDSFHTPKQIENKSNVNSLFENLFKSYFIYADFSYQRESFDKFIHLTSHTKFYIFFFTISENLDHDVGLEKKVAPF